MSRSALNSSRTDNRRASELAKIHIAKKRLRLDDDTYRAIIARVCGGKTSAADLTQEERGKLLNEFQRFGFLEGASYTTSLDDFDDREPQARLIRALWADLTAIGALHDSSERALRGFIKRTAKSDSINWLSALQANACIEALKSMKRRAGHRQASTSR
jgi:phage gp16-like protein